MTPFWNKDHSQSESVDGVQLERLTPDFREHRQAHVVFLSNPAGEIITLTFDPHEWEMINQVAAIASTTLEDVITDVAYERYINREA